MGTPEQRTARLGLYFFFFYAVFYGAFVYMCAFHQDLMTSHGGQQVNVAVWYGFTLIVSPLILALIYARLCRRTEAFQPGDPPP